MITIIALFLVLSFVLVENLLVNAITWPECYDVDKNCDDVDFTLSTVPNMGRTMLNDGTFVNTNWEGKGFGGSQAKKHGFFILQPQESVG
mmetsp:Transcript_6283/g.13107  ORF Transcript_6283/g.13107 Transcript_6283/m.13107 type:complete len:90 (+) Transcript_6283:159-428(+)